MKIQKSPKPAIIVIFGITGDLSKRKLLPALYHLIKSDLLHENTRILGVTRQNITKKDLFDNVDLCVNEEKNICDPLAVKKMQKITQMHTMDMSIDSEYEKLSNLINVIEDEQNVCMERIFYLSIPPQAFDQIVEYIGKNKLNIGCQHEIAGSNLVIEKPFGFDLDSGKELIKKTGKYFNENQIYRIDHYLAKETVQDILQFRYANPIFAPIWNNKYVDNILIQATEEIGIENRINFYDKTGALRDFVQSHLLQLLTLVTMELPEKLNSSQIHHNKQQLFDQIQPIPKSKVEKRAIRGQYEGYKDQVENPLSFTETYAELELFIANHRWNKVPMRLITGKAMGKKRTDITLQFRTDKNGEYNRLTFRIQPNEGIELRLKVKKPGFAQTSQTALMDFDYEKTFDNHGHPDAYERVILDAIKGDHMLFATSQEVIAGWKIIQPVLDVWSKNSDGIKIYPIGSDGPN